MKNIRLMLCCQSESVIWNFLGRLEIHPRPHGDAGVLRTLTQTIRDGLRRICHGEHASIRFCFQLDPAFFEPAYRIGRLEAGEGTAQLRRAARIVGDKPGRVKTGMCDITPAAARDQHLSESLPCLFEDQHL